MLCSFFVDSVCFVVFEFLSVAVLFLFASCDVMLYVCFICVRLFYVMVLSLLLFCVLVLCFCFVCFCRFCYVMFVYFMLFVYVLFFKFVCFVVSLCFVSCVRLCYVPLVSLCYYFDIVNMLFSFLLCYYDLEYVLLVCVRFFLFLFGLGYVSSMFLNF